MVVYGFWRWLVVAVEWIFNTYSFLIIIRTLLSWMGPLPYHPLVRHLKRLTDPVLRLVHRYFPFAVISGIDVAPMIVLLLLYLCKSIIVRLIYRMLFYV